MKLLRGKELVYRPPMPDAETEGERVLTIVRQKTAEREKSNKTALNKRRISIVLLTSVCYGRHYACLQGRLLLSETIIGLSGLNRLGNI